jgi:benzoate transport
MDVREEILNRPMRPFQIRVLVMCILLTMIDGYEILVMAFVAPHLAKTWQLGPVQVGYLLSAGVFGMALGATLISPLADRIGRRRHILICLTFITIGMALSAFAENLTQLVIFRAFAGIFIGAVLSSLNILVSEYCSNKRRGTVMGIYGIGLNAGVVLGGAVTNVLIATYTWRAPFVFGALITAVLLLVGIKALPESLAFLIEKRPKGALEQYNAISERLGHARSEGLPKPLEVKSTNATEGTLLRGAMLPRTLSLWLGYACVIAAFYFANTWTAKLMSDAAGNVNMGAKVGILIAVGGIVGSLLFAGLSAIIRPRLVTIFLLTLGAIVYVLYANMYQSAGIALLLAVCVGIVSNGGIAAFYAISPSVFATTVRGTGVGLMIGIGRGIAILSPIMTGYLIKAGWTPQSLYQCFAGLFIVAALAIFSLDRTYRGRAEDPDALAALNSAAVASAQ